MALRITPASTGRTPSHTVPHFDRLARSYRWLERFTFGPALQHCRTRLLPELAPSLNALVLGDGDGRALAALLRRQPSLTATAVDLSPAMLRELRHQCAAHDKRLTTLSGDAPSVLRSLPAGSQFDLVTSHFFLDCLHPPEIERLVAEVNIRTVPGSHWLLSEFRIPPGWRSLPARVLVRLLYFAFRVLTGLRVHTLPDHARPLLRGGWIPIRVARSLGGLLTAEIWRREPPSRTAL